MGTAEFDFISSTIIIHSHIILYGGAATDTLAENVREEIDRMWNEPQALVPSMEREWRVRFNITGESRPGLDQLEVIANVDPKMNYFRVEEKLHGNISFVDGIGSNTGMFQADNLYAGSTTAAHEYGHTIGLDHPRILDIRGAGVPGIMYPRGTRVDAIYQYNPQGRSGDSQNGGTMHPKYRRVLAADIAGLKLHKLSPDNPILGAFSSVWHDPHFS